MNDWYIWYSRDDDLLMVICLGVMSFQTGVDVRGIDHPIIVIKSGQEAMTDSAPDGPRGKKHMHYGEMWSN